MTPQLIAWLQATILIQRMQRMAASTLRRVQRDVRQKLLPAPPSLKLLPPPK